MKLNEAKNECSDKTDARAYFQKKRLHSLNHPIKRIKKMIVENDNL